MSNRFPADDEHLHPYPGNLKHHKVDKEEQRKLLCEMMKDDAKSGLYNEKKREPLLSDEDLQDEDRGVFGMEREEVRDFYEAARAKDAETIQMLLDAFNDCCDDLSGVLGLIPAIDGHVLNLAVGVYQEVINEAAKEGFKPTYP